MSRKDEKSSIIEETITEEESLQLENQNIPHYIEIDPNIDVVAIPLPMANALMEMKKPLSSIGLFFIYLIYNKLYGKMPTVIELTEMGVGSAPKIASIRKVLIEEGFLKVKIIRKEGRIVAKRTYLTSPRLRNLNVRKPTGNIIINNINTPDSPSKKSGCVSLKDSIKEKPSKTFPRKHDFDSLWNINRHPVNKEESRKAWKSQLIQKELPPLDLLLEAYEADAKSNDWDNTEKRHIPHLSTWLRGKRWQNHTGELVDSSGGVHIMAQLKRSDGIENAKQLRDEINENCISRGGKINKSFTRKYVKWLTGPDSPPASSKDSIKDVYIYGLKYWGVYVEIMAGTEIETF